MTTILFLDAFTKHDYFTLPFILVPILLSLFVSMKTNFLHGLVSYLLLTFFTVYFLELSALDSFFAKFLPGENIETILTANKYLVNFVNELLCEIPKVGDIVNASYGQHVLLAFYVVWFLLSCGVASIFKRLRRGY